MLMYKKTSVQVEVKPNHNNEADLNAFEFVVNIDGNSFLIGFELSLKSRK